jgi:LmbE family N-acetylglucosaminyl deacetylase
MSGSGTLVALSPHLDDAVFSVGAFMHEQARGGLHVHVVTVFANDPSADGRPGSWDAMCGFASSAAAARARREEDRQACAIIGAKPHWLPFGDDTYGPRNSGEEIWDGIRGLIDACDVLLVPGFPLRHSDHAALAQLVVQRRRELKCALGFYAEQPYATRAENPTAPLALEFEQVAAGAKDRYAKLRAALQYRSQLRSLGRRPLLRAFLEGERVALRATSEGSCARGALRPRLPST